jgi:hypothetical protein
MPHLVKKLSLFQSIFGTLIKNHMAIITWAYFRTSILFHWSIFLFLWLYNVVFDKVWLCSIVCRVAFWWHLPHFFSGISFKLTALCLQSRCYTTCTRPSALPFCSGYFGDGVSQNMFMGWHQNMILLFSSSQVDKITGVSHWHPITIALYQSRLLWIVGVSCFTI